ncbi:MAG TPA: CvpA family protein [Xanthobacteraceae bacterium]|jgi:membrane protein required for colicin V production
MPLTLLDIGLLVVMLISGILAMVRGFMREILSIAAWLIAAVVTLYGYARAELYIRDYVSNDLLAKGIAIGGLFLITLLVVSLFTIKISDLVLDSRVGALDRSLGFLFGLGRGLIIMVVAFLFFAWLVPSKSQPDWVSGARSRVVLQATGDWLLSILPDDPETAILKRLRQPRGDEPPADRPSPVQPAPSGPVQTVPGQKSDRGASPSRVADANEGEAGYKRTDRQGFEQLLEGARGAPH